MVDKFVIEGGLHHFVIQVVQVVLCHLYRLFVLYGFEQISDEDRQSFKSTKNTKYPEKACFSSV